MTKQFEGKVALVTGASAGIGKATAIAFGREGAGVVVAARREAESLETVAEIEALGSKAIFVPTDVKEPDQIEAMVQAAKDEFGGLDFAFNNAGESAGIGLLHEITDETWTHYYEVFLKSVYLCMKAQIPLMLERGGGSIVNNSSMAGLIGSPNVAYTAMKHGVIGLTKATSHQYANDGVRINAVCPGWIETDMTSGFRERQEWVDFLMFGSSIKRPGNPDEVASLVIWLCSEGASFTTATAIPVSGGLLA